MALNKIFVILALVASCALAMPVHPIDQTTQSVEVESTSASINIKLEDSTTVQESITTVATDETTNDKDESSAVADSTVDTLVHEELVDQVVAKRSIDQVSSNDDGDDDLETAAGTNVLRPLFVYRQQVAYRQRVRNANRRGNRRF